MLNVDLKIKIENLCNADTLTKSKVEHEILKRIAAEKYPEDKSEKIRFLTWIFGLIAALILLALVLFISIGRFWITKQKLEKMETEWLETFHAGQESLIDWNEDIVKQAGLLPYRSEFEFPLENLEIEENVLGQGEFGVVHRATAKGLGKNKSETFQVAVKKNTSTKLSEIKSFADELKIMMFLQKVNKKSHVNVINILGAITCELQNGKIYAIMELCQYGSLKNFLMKNINQFKDQFGCGKAETDNEIHDQQPTSGNAPVYIFEETNEQR